MEIACLDCGELIEYQADQLLREVTSLQLPKAARCRPCYLRWRVDRTSEQDEELRYFRWAVGVLGRKGAPPPPSRVHERLVGGPYGGQWTDILRAWELRRMEAEK